MSVHKIRAAHYYLGTWRQESGFVLTNVCNPATGRTIGVCPTIKNDDGDDGDVRKDLVQPIFEAARVSQQYWYHEVSIPQKQKIFLRIAELFEERRAELVWTMIKEGGKLWKWADAEVTEAIDTYTDYHGELNRAYSPRGVSRCQMEKKVIESYRKPKGVIFAIGPWNFPLAIIGAWKTAGALAGGNAVILKPAEQTPFTAQLGVTLIHQAMKDVLGARFFNMQNLVQLLHGKGEITGKLILDSGLYHKVVFTGGIETGRIVASTAGRLIRECHLELGGHAAMVVLSDFDLERAIKEAIRGCLGDSGQRCVSTRALWIPGRHFQAGLQLYIDHAKRFRIGRPDDFASDMGPLVSREQLERVDFMVQETIKQGGACILGGYPLNKKTMARAKEEGLNFDEDAIYAGGYYYAPTVFVEASYGMVAMDEEIFGPVICINSLAERALREEFENGVRYINQARQGLSNALLTNDAVLIKEAPFRIETGILYGRRGTTGAETNQDFGGVKDSGFGTEGRGIESFTDPMTYYIDLADEPRMAQAGEDKKIQKMLSSIKSPFFD